MSSNQPNLDQLPPDLRGQIVALLAHKDEQLARKDEHLAEKSAQISQKTDIIEKLLALIKEFRQARFGATSEKANPEQYSLAFEDIETALASAYAEQDDIEPEPEKIRKPRAVGRGHLPKHLPRIEKIIEPDSTICSCGCQMHVIGEDSSERLDIIPASFRVLVTRRPRYACRSCTDGVSQARAPERLIPGGLPTEATIAHVLISKYADHLPLHRQAQIFARQGVDLDRSTLAHWTGTAAYALTPVFDALAAHIKTSSKLFMDETTAPVLDPGRGRTKTGYLWALARDDRPWRSGPDSGGEGEDPPAVAYFYAPGRSGKHAEGFLEGFCGILQVDGYAGYNRLTRSDRKGGALQLAYCWAHARRNFFKLTKAGLSPVAEEAIRRIGEFYQIEENIRGTSPSARRAVRQGKTAPLLEDMAQWLRQEMNKTSYKSPIGKALAYVIKHWDGLTLFLDDGRVELDNNTVERSIRPLVINRKNALFAGHDAGGRNWGIIASLIETCKLNNINPQAYMTKTLEALVNGHKQSQIDELRTPVQ
ncbi:MAG: IS66 family transposase [Emcibacter sp.]|nr:IS66 family transposase [Emcibacter sp.]